MLTLHNKDFTTKYGAINTTIEAFVEEERNGLFELSFIMLNTDSLFNYIKEDNIVVANANDTLLNQKFRIYMTRKLMNNRVEVFARHISFDLMYDYIDNISFENQSCEYALNMLFRNSNFSKHYKGYSDIINAQDYNMSMANILEAIGGKEGSIIDTFGTGAELLRDNENIHVLNKRGYDNEVTIEYKKNLTGFELEEDTTELITRILPYAKYTPQDEEGNSLEEVIVKASFVDSPLIANYSHPFIRAIDYSDKFDDENIPTVDKLRALAELEYKNNKVDMPKQNFKIEFIPLSKCVGYEGLEDNISLCDTVTIKDTRYNINTQAKVIKVTYNVLKNRYESMELGEPKTSLGDIIGNNNSTKGEKGDKGDKGEPGKDGSIGDFPNSLPSTPIVTAKVYGFANIEISWTFENKVYYQYEVYASKEADFTPNTFNLIHSGQTSTYMYQAKPGETWYFKVCCVNSHGERTDFGASYATTTKIDDLSNYVSEMAIDEALIGTLSLDRGWFGSLKGNYIDAKQLSVTDGNGKRTLDIDSFGNVNIQASNIKMLVNGNSQDIATQSQLQLSSEALQLKFQQSGGYNLLYNGDFKNKFTHWAVNTSANMALETGLSCPTGRGVAIYSKIGQTTYVKQSVDLDGGVDSYTCSCYMYCSDGQDGTTNPFYNLYGEVHFTDGTIEYYGASVSTLGVWQKVHFTFKKPPNKTFRTAHIFGYVRDTTKDVYFSQFMLEKGEVPSEWSPNPNEIHDGVTRIDKEGVQVIHSDGSCTRMNSREFYATNQNGVKTFSTRRGGLWGYNIDDGSVNYTVTTTKMQNSGAKGMSIISSNNNASYLTIGTSDEFTTDTDTVNTTPNMVIVGKTFGDTTWGKTIGTHFINKPVHIWTLSYMHNPIHIDSGTDYYHFIANMSGSKLGLYGDSGVNIGVRAGSSNIPNFGLTEDSSNAYGYFSVYGNWYFNNYTAYNLKTANSLEAQSQRLRNYQSKNKELNNLYGSFSFYDNEFTYTDTTSHIIPYGEFELLIEIPQILSENMQNEYHVNISKNSFGDYRIKEKNNYYFIIETDRFEDFSFTYQIVGKLIEKAKNNIVIANNSINIDSEDIKEPVKVTIENEINKDLIKQ